MRRVLSRRRGRDLSPTLWVGMRVGCAVGLSLAPRPELCFHRPDLNCPALMGKWARGDCTANFLGGRKAATKFFGTLGRSTWTCSHVLLSLSAIPVSGPLCDKFEGRMEAEAGSSISPPLLRPIPNDDCDPTVRSFGGVSGLRCPISTQQVDRIVVVCCFLGHPDMDRVSSEWGR